MSNPQVDALMALVDEYSRSRWSECCSECAYDRLGARQAAEEGDEAYAALRTALEAALPSGRDGERYRWIKAQRGLEISSYGQSAQWVRPDGSKFYASHRLVANGTDYGAHETLDAAIDAAMSAAPAMGAPEEGEPAAPSQGTLTDEEIIAVRKAQSGRYGSNGLEPYADSIAFARAILAAQAKQEPQP
jgi:hypothetical protein